MNGRKSIFVRKTMGSLQNPGRGQGLHFRTGNSGFTVAGSPDRIPYSPMLVTFSKVSAYISVCSLMRQVPVLRK